MTDFNLLAFECPMLALTEQGATQLNGEVGVKGDIGSK